jgi:cytochrome c peroxidase
MKGAATRAFVLGAIVAFAGAPACADDPPELLPLPRGLKSAPEFPADNPFSPAKAALGRILFFDKRLSDSGKLSCASCHDPAKGWSGRAPKPPGAAGPKDARKVPTLLNTAYLAVRFWDGRSATLENMILTPLRGSTEIDWMHEETANRIAAVRGYAPYFKDAFGDETIDLDRVAKALATFERTLLSGDSPYDRWVDGDAASMDASAARGRALFIDPKKGDCASCHSGPYFSDSDFHNAGIGLKAKTPDLGRFDVTQDEKDRGAFRTPTLRNLVERAPYMHDGSLKTLEDVVAFHSKGLTPDERADLAAFLRALSGANARIDAPKLPE